MSVTIHLPIAPIRRALITATALVITLGLAAELAFHIAGARSDVVPMFSLSYEANVPTWYASSLLLLAALGLAAASARARQDRGRWAFLAAVFVYMSVDEAVELHERLNDLIHIDGAGGAFTFDWILPAGALLAVLAVAYVPFLRRLPARTRRRFIVAGALYVGGALLMEMPLGIAAARAGEDSLAYSLLDFVEEALELVGLTVFLLALLDHLRGAEP